MTTKPTPSISGFSFADLTIEKIIVHRIFQKDANKQIQQPDTSDDLVHLTSQNGKDALQKRIRDALGNKSHGIEMTVASTDHDSFFALATSMLRGDDADFIDQSKVLAKSLTKAQSTSNALGGVLAVISGRVGSSSLPYLAVIKAEPQEGFQAVKESGKMTIKYIDDLLLTESQRLYKIGFLVETLSSPPDDDGVFDVNNYRCFLFDHLMTATETRNAAQYFYQTFLGMSIQSSSKKQTRDFFEFTKLFINTAAISDDDKMDLHEALRSELRSTSATISTNTFAVNNIQDAGLRTQYAQFMGSKGFPNYSINKDNDYIKNKLKNRRKYAFTNDVYISTPAEKADNYLTINKSEDGSETIVTIKGKLKGEP